MLANIKGPHLDFFLGGRPNSLSHGSALYRNQVNAICWTWGLARLYTNCGICRPNKNGLTFSCSSTPTKLTRSTSATPGSTSIARSTSDSRTAWAGSTILTPEWLLKEKDNCMVASPIFSPVILHHQCCWMILAQNKGVNVWTRGEWTSVQETRLTVRACSRLVLLLEAGLPALTVSCME